jgi:serine/threonine protein kinase/tetratricopeptide (TPR) repeat protein
MSGLDPVADSSAACEVRGEKMSELRDQLQKTLGGSYSLERELGGGGMSRVFVAEETSLGRKVVVKVLPPDLAAAVNLERFRREIQLAAKLQHPHIVPVLAAGVSEGLPYYTMPFIEGETLRAKLSRGGELPIHDAVRILRDTLSALSYAHDHGVVHRDIKPDNILLTGGHAVVADFGVAKAISASTNPGSSLTSLGVALGTPAYMSPEQAAADPTTDHRSDLYSVGAVAYEMLSGQQLFSNRSPQAMLAAQAMEEPEPLERRRKSVPPALSAVIMRALEKHAADRPQSAAEMLAQLDAAVTPSSATTPYTGTMPARKVVSSTRSTWMAVAAAVLLLSLGSSSWYWYEHKRPVVPAVAEGSTSDSTASLAVLPFENLGKPDDAYFADGMTEEISSRLGELSGLRVIGRQSVRGYANSNKTISQIGKELGVGYVLTGSVRWDKSVPGKSRVRVSPALLRTSDGSQVWSEPYEDEVSGVFQIQSKVAQRVADALKIQLNRGEQQALATRPTQNVEAYDAYLRAKTLVDNSTTGQGGNFLRAAGILQHAVELDPKFGDAWSELGRAHIESYWFAADVTPRRLELSKAAIDHALALDPNSARAHTALGTYFYHGKLDYPRALEEYAVAERLAPNDAEAIGQKALVERRQGKWDDALADFRKAILIEPRSVYVLQSFVETLALTRRLDAADTAARRLIALDPTSPNGYTALAGVYISEGNVPRTVATLREMAANVSAGDGDLQLLGFSWPANTDHSLLTAMHNASPPTSLGDRLIFFQGKLALAIYEKDAAGTRAAADSVISSAQSQLSGTFLDADSYAAMAIGYAAKGDRGKAMASAQKATDLVPVSRDALRGAFLLASNVQAMALLGDANAAIPILDQLLRIPSSVKRANLRVDPAYDLIRKDSRFQKLVAGN